MQFFSIGIEKQNWRFKNQLLKRLEGNMPDGFTITECQYENICYLKFFSEANYRAGQLMDIKDLLSHSIGCAFAQFLLYDIREEIIDRIIKKEYFYFEADEKKAIFEKTKDESINSDERKWAAYIHGKLTEYFSENREVSIEGFIRFRIKEYIDELGFIVETSVDEHLIDKEYNEFIKLLRYFVEIQEPKIEEVHVLLEGDKKYTLLDSGFRVINNDMLEDMAREISDTGISNDDLLISSLITIAPNRIVIHDSNKIKNTELLNTIKNVFCGKVEMKN